MKRSFFFVLVLLAPFFARAGVVDTMWLRLYFGSDSASASWNRAADMAADRDGNIYVCGAGEKAVAGSNDMLLVKYNRWGETLWVRSYGGATGSDDDIAQALAVDSVGNVYVVGATEYPAPADVDITWLKYDSIGNLLWARRTGLPDDDIGYDIVIGKQGDVYICGATTNTHYNLSTFFVARIDPWTGNTIWTRSYILDTLAFNTRKDRHPDFVLMDWDQWDNCATALAISPDSGHIVATGFGSHRNRGYQIWTMKFLPNGTRRWERDYGRTYYDYDDVGFDVAVANNGYIFVAGFDENDANYYDALLLRYSPTGGNRLTRHINDPIDDEDYFFAVTLDDSNPQNVYATGAYYQSTTSRFDIITYKANIGLSPRWGNAGTIFATNQDDYGFDITYCRGRVYVAGQRGNDLVVLAYTATNTTPHDTLWTFTYNSPYNQEDFGAAVCALDSDNVYIAGQVGRSSISGGPCDLVTARLFYPYPDMQVKRIVAPAETVGYHDTITPQVQFVNTGNTLARFTARLRIGSGYNSTVNRESPLYPGDSCLIDFVRWIAEPLGRVAVACTVALPGDQRPWNDTLSSSVQVVMRDVGCFRIVAPIDTVDSGAVVQPRAFVRNYGGLSAIFPVRMTIGASYQEIVNITLAPGDSVLVLFPEWHASQVGTWAVRCSTMLASDGNPANDYCDGVVVVRENQASWPPGWKEVKSMPLVPSPNPVREGGWLAVDEDHGLVYGAKGAKTGDFYSYNPLRDSWTVLTSLPPGPEGKLCYKGAAGCYGEGYVYAVKGNNTLEFWRYATDRGEWEQLPDVPLGRSGKKVKGGGDMVYVSEAGVGYVYFLKGYKQDFMRFNTVTRTWENMPDAPAGAMAKWGKGSWLVYAGDASGGIIYAHKAKFHELWLFDVLTHEWLEKLPGMPFQSERTGKNKKSQNGGAACWFNDKIYALKGNNTCELWMYDLMTEVWTELDPMPEVGTTGKKKRVKGGGDIVSLMGALWALKGNKTVEFWRYGFATAGENSGGLIRTMSEKRVAPKIAELAFTSRTISYTISQPGLVRLTIYDQMGRRHWELKPGFQSAGEYRVNLGENKLAPGIYFIRLEVANSGQIINQTTGKLVKLK